MCGIAGIISKNKQNVTQQSLQYAATALTHRGPEGKGFFINDKNNAGLAHCRLRIIDLSDAAAQPFNYLTRFFIIHNGELYNYTEIKKQLRHKGFVFTTESDTEVIVAAYAAYGASCLQQFDGMFSFAIWDEQDQTLFAARDRMGEKPFFFFYDEEQFVFASEINALWQMSIGKNPNHAMLYNFINIGYTTNPTEPRETFFENIQKLPAANYLEYHLPTNKLTLHNYWQVFPQVDNSISETEAIEKYEKLFSASINRRLRSDVAIGTSLSGGLDSSAIVAFCNQQESAAYTHRCFTASFAGFEKDELHYAKQVANQFGLQHFVADIKNEEVVELMDKVMQQQQEPIASGSALAQYKVYELAKQNGITVLLDGQGADEILGGYHKYYKWHWQDLYRQKKLSASGELSAAKALGVIENFGWKNKMAALLPQLAGGLLQSKKTKQAYQNKSLNSDWAFAHKQQLYYSLPATPDLNGALHFNSFVNGLEELLRIADRNSMAHAVEVRLPFLNYELIEFLFTLPPHYKIQKGFTKWLLRRAVQNKLPEAIVWRNQKVGFEPPQKQWMQNSSVAEAIMDAKEKLVAQHILKPSVLQKKIQPHSAYAAENNEWKYWSAAYLFA